MKRDEARPAVSLEARETALLEMAAAKPLRSLPPLHLAIAQRLARRGLMCLHDGLWHPTALALKLLSRTLH